MAVAKRILCLANSRKPGGRCVAGREILPIGAGPWIRPVSQQPGEAVSWAERRYADDRDPAVLDVMDVPLLESRPHACQTENWLLDPSRRWQFVRRASWAELLRFVESPQTLWLDGRRSYHGENDEILQSVADSLPGSLHLIQVPRVVLTVSAEGAAFGDPRRRVRAQFRYGNSNYALKVTDPKVEGSYIALGDGDHSLGECCLTISLGEPFETKGQLFRYKLVAAIIDRSESDGG